MQEKKSLWHAFRLKRVLAANLAIFGLVGWGFSGQVLQNGEMQDEIARLEQQANALHSKNVAITELGKRFASPEMAEREARMKLNLQKPGESVIIVRNDASISDAGATGQSAGAVGTEEQLPNPQKWWHYFFH